MVIISLLDWAFPKDRGWRWIGFFILFVISAIIVMLVDSEAYSSESAVTFALFWSLITVGIFCGLVGVLSERNTIRRMRVKDEERRAAIRRAPLVGDTASFLLRLEREGYSHLAWQLREAAVTGTEQQAMDAAQAGTILQRITTEGQETKGRVTVFLEELEARLALLPTFRPKTWAVIFITAMVLTTTEEAQPLTSFYLSVLRALFPDSQGWKVLG